MNVPLYMITAHHGIEGVALSRPGHWGGFRYPDIEAARAAASVDAKGPMVTMAETVKPRRSREA